MKETTKLGNRRAIQSVGIPVKILKQNVDIFGSYICHFFNVCVDMGTFSTVLKHANITLEKVLCNQITPSIDQLQPRYHCGFRRDFSTQHYLLPMLEKYRKAVDTKKDFGARLADLSKVFDCLPHDFSITKLNAYGFSLPALKLIQNYLANIKHRTKINDS